MQSENAQPTEECRAIVKDKFDRSWRNKDGLTKEWRKNLESQQKEQRRIEKWEMLMGQWQFEWDLGN